MLWGSVASRRRRFGVVEIADEPVAAGQGAELIQKGLCLLKALHGLHNLLDHRQDQPLSNYTE